MGIELPNNHGPSLSSVGGEGVKVAPERRGGGVGSGGGFRTTLTLNRDEDTLSLSSPGPGAARDPPGRGGSGFRWARGLQSRCRGLRRALTAPGRWERRTFGDFEVGSGTQPPTINYYRPPECLLLFIIYVSHGRGSMGRSSRLPQLEPDTRSHG